MNQLKTALIHAAKVALFLFLSSIIPALVSYLTNDVRYMAYTPVINMVAAGLKKYLETE